MRNYTIFVFMLISAISGLAFAESSHYAIIVDAGSSGSRLHIFEYNNTAKRVPVIKDIFSEATKPGLSSFAEHPEDASSSLKKLLDDATQALQQQQINPHAVTINILATAGMRLLPEYKQTAIYTNVINYLKNNYAFIIGEVTTINGKTEGLYGWLDINYLLGNFATHQATMGSLDMGGASTQIAFATEDNIKPEDRLFVTIANQHYQVFSKSFLGLGQDQARDSMLNHVAANSCYPRNYFFKETEVGDFLLESCQAAYTQLIQDKQVSSQLESTHGQSFVAYSGIYYSYNFFNVEKTPDATSFESRLRTVCNKTWQELQQEYPQIPEKYLATYCANGVYFDELLYYTYGLDGSRLIVTNKINGREIDWTMGAMLYRVSNSDVRGY